MSRDTSTDALTQLIQGGGRARYGNVDAARWDHSWLIVSASGDIVEANHAGIERKNISEYRDQDFMVLSPDGVSATTRQLACDFMLAHVGDSYGIVNFICLAVQALFGWTIAFHIENQFTCSGAVSRATEKYVASYPRSPESMMPADLVVYWGATSGEALLPLPFFSRFLDRVRTIIGAIFRHGHSTDPPGDN